VGINRPDARYVETREKRLSDHIRFEELVLPHLDAAYNLARWLARNPHDAEDVVQDACIRALRYVGSLHGADARAWFLTIVRNAFYDWLGRNRPAEVVHDEEDTIATMVDPSAPDPQQESIRNAEMQALSAAISALPLQYREVLVLRELEELSYKEIAIAVGSTEGAARVHYHNAMRAIREKIDE